LSAVDDFLRNVLRSGLLQRDELQNSLRTLPTERREDVAAISDHLIGAGKLTRFQAHKILQGITVGLVLGTFHLLVPLGRGGMGTVYLARDARTQEHVALKILPPKLARTKERLLARFQREMELSQKIKHPHLARAAEVGTFQNVHFIAMEFIPGRTLYRLVTTEGPLPVPRVAHLFAEVASALAHAHRQNVIHRDLKPSNLMITPRDHAKVLDLGLAFTEGEEVDDREVVGGKGYIVGSIDYMAPEQTRDPTNIDARADLYALGACMYFALTGVPLFPEGTVHEKVKAHRHEPPPRVRSKNPQVPEGFAEIVHKLLAKRPEDRYGSAIELAYALEPWRGSEVLPLDMPQDVEFQQGVQTVIDGWVAPEPAKEAQDALEDAVIFQIDAEEKQSTAEHLASSIFREADRVPPHVWVLGVVGAWLVLLLMCIVGSCAMSGFR
jgi:eukaryotic-like serine/threonine-protein kinase